MRKTPVLWKPDNLRHEIIRQAAKERWNNMILPTAITVRRLTNKSWLSDVLEISIPWITQEFAASKSPELAIDLFFAVVSDDEYDQLLGSDSRLADLLAVLRLEMMELNTVCLSLCWPGDRA